MPARKGLKSRRVCSREVVSRRRLNPILTKTRPNKNDVARAFKYLKSQAHNSIDRDSPKGTEKLNNEIEAHFLASPSVSELAEEKHEHVQEEIRKRDVELRTTRVGLAVQVGPVGGGLTKDRSPPPDYR